MGRIAFPSGRARSKKRSVLVVIGSGECSRQRGIRFGKGDTSFSAALAWAWRQRESRRGVNEWQGNMAELAASTGGDDAVPVVPVDQFLRAMSLRGAEIMWLLGAGASVAAGVP